MEIRRIALIVAAAGALAACAPEGLDYTPTVTPTLVPSATNTREPTNTPAPTNTPQPTVEGAEATAESAEPQPTEDTASAFDTTTPEGLVNAVIASIPNPLGAGTIQWQQTNDEVTGQRVVNPNVQGGFAGKVFFSERGGGAADVTLAVFEDETAATAYFEGRSTDRRLENSDPEADLPAPNMFGGGTYGSLGLIQDGNIVLVVSVPRFSSTVRGNPTIPLAEQFLRLIDAAQG